MRAAIALLLVGITVKAQPAVMLFQPTADCTADCESERRLSEKEGRSLQPGCDYVGATLPLSCNVPNLVDTADADMIPVEAVFYAGACLNTTTQSGGQPTSMKIDCNGTSWIGTLEYHNNTATCASSGVYKKTLVVNTRYGDAPDLNNGPGGDEGNLQNLASGKFGMKCYSNAAGFAVQSEYTDNGCTTIQEAVFGGGQQVHMFPIGVCVQSMDFMTSSNSRWKMFGRNATHVSQKAYGNVTGSSEGKCQGDHVTSYFKIGECSNGKVFTVSAGAFQWLSTFVLAVALSMTFMLS